MPYIKQDRREVFYASLQDLTGKIETEGELNYVITRLAHALINELGGNYAAHNSVIGVLECAKLELYRRRLGPYEDECIKKNGDI